MRFSRSGFTLLEMMVVVAIILILAGMVVPKLADALGKGHETKCRTNLRQLQVGVMNYVMDKGTLPPAMSYETYSTETREWSEHRGWVTWVPTSGGIDKLDSMWPNKEKQSPYLNDDLGYGESAKFGVEYGGLFQYMNDSFESYVCPVMRNLKAKSGANNADFDSKDEDKIKQNIFRTYAMSPISGNQIDGQNYSGDNVPGLTEVGTSLRYRFGSDDETKYLPQPAKLLMFADVAPDIMREHIGRSGNGKAQNGADCCLSPETKSDKNEVMAEIHSGASKTEKTAMVVFYDGHIEKVLPFENDENAAWYYNRGLGITAAADGDKF